MRNYVTDLHVHTVLSPCADIEMTPRNIVRNAEDHGIDIIAVTDHNASENIEAVIAAARGTTVTIIPGMEVETKEEVHLLTLFDNLHQMKQWQSMIQTFYSGRKNDTSKLGGQFIVNEYDQLLAEKEEMLLSSLTIGIEEVAVYVEKIGGIVIASHVDRPAYSLLAQLGFIPQSLNLSAAEVSQRVPLHEALSKYPVLANIPIITSSDAHYMKDFVYGPKTVFYLEKPNLEEIKLALLKQQGRIIVM